MTTDDGRRKITTTVKRVYVDVESGEERTLMHEEPLRRRPPKDLRSREPFTMGFPEGLSALALMPLTGDDWSVLAHLVGIMGYEEDFKAGPTEIGEALGRDKRNVSRSLGHLHRLGVTIPAGRARVWIHPDYFWRGSVSARMRLLQQIAKKSSAAPREEATDEAAGSAQVP